MGLCEKCLFYSKVYDEQGMDFNDIGNPNNHYCTMYQDAIPDGIFQGNKDCSKFEEKEVRP